CLVQKACRDEGSRSFERALSEDHDPKQVQSPHNRIRIPTRRLEIRIFRPLWSLSDATPLTIRSVVHPCPLLVCSRVKLVCFSLTPTKQASYNLTRCMIPRIKLACCTLVVA